MQYSFRINLAFRATYSIATPSGVTVSKELPKLDNEIFMSRNSLDIFQAVNLRLHPVRIMHIRWLSLSAPSLDDSLSWTQTTSLFSIALVAGERDCAKARHRNWSRIIKIRTTPKPSNSQSQLQRPPA
jgi:hypothetical protein